MARERYLVNAGEDTIHQNEIVADTAKKRRKNWWDYHKKHLVVGILCGAIVFSLIYSVVSKVKPDYTIALITSYTMPTNGTDQLARCVEQYADDRNGDGRVSVSVVDYVISSTVPSTTEAYQQQQAYIARFYADVATNDSMIFLYDEVAFKMLADDMGGMFQYNDGTPMPDDARDYENAATDWADIPAFSEFEPETGEEDAFDPEMLKKLYGTLKVSLRTAAGSSIERSEKTMAYYEDSVKLFERLKAGEPYSQPQPEK